MSRRTTYVGERDADGIGHVYVEQRESGRLIRRFELPHVVRHSPTGLEWGYGGSGPADLALSIMAHINEVQGVSVSLYQTFKMDVVSGLDRDGFQLHASDVREWLSKRWSAMDEEGIRADFRAA